LLSLSSKYGSDVDDISGLVANPVPKTVPTLVFRFNDEANALFVGNVLRFGISSILTLTLGPSFTVFVGGFSLSSTGNSSGGNSSTGTSSSGNSSSGGGLTVIGSTVGSVIGGVTGGNTGAVGSVTGGVVGLVGSVVGFVTTGPVGPVGLVGSTIGLTIIGPGSVIGAVGSGSVGSISGGSGPVGAGNFGSSDGVLGYRIETLTDKNGNTYNQLSVATGPNSSKTFGAGFKQGADGKYSVYSPSSSSTTSTASTTSTTSTTLKTAEQIAADAAKAQAQGERQSAYDLLYSQFSQYGLGSLVEPLKGLITSGASPAEFTIKLRESEPYKRRFSANAQRISKGLKAINEAEYLGLEDQYQSILRNAGLPESYWKRGDLGMQEGFTNFIANDVSPIELEDRVSTAQKRLLYANPEVSIALKTFYPDITNGDLLAYALDPTKGLEQIKRRITAAEVGSSAVQLGLATNVTDAEYLARYGVTKQTAQQGYSTIAGGLERGSQLASIYGEDPYTQTTAEREVFNVPGAQEARKQRQKITGLEKATFGGQSGVSSSALARDRAGNF
jgi:hypothetical protein